MPHELDPMLTLAMNVHAQPGVYALLLGSGLSTAAGIPTGWQIVEDLVAQAAAARNPGDTTAAEVARADPEAWWSTNGNGTSLGYSNLLASVASTSAARQALLARYFQPSDADLAANKKVPTAAHVAIAAMVKAGWIRVILTTNFDPLLERALTDVGVAPVVLSNDTATAAAAPLTHTACVVVKLHGDWLDLEQRNTVDELSTYSDIQNQLLNRVFSEYGLIVSGWSGAWDIALVHALEGSAARRYPMYWATFGAPGAEASKLIALHGARTLPDTSADDLFTGLRDRLEALDSLAEPPLSTAMKLDRLKQQLLEPRKRIQVHDLILDETSRVTAAVANLDLAQSQAPDGLDAVMKSLESATAPLIELVTTGIYFDRDRQHLDLWVDVVARLIRARRTPSGTSGPYIDQLQHYPAMLTLCAAGIAAVLTNRDDVLIELLTRPFWRRKVPPSQDEPAFIALNDWRLFDRGLLNSLPRFGGSARWLWLNSKLLREVLADRLQRIEPDAEQYEMACSRYEYRFALTDFVLNPADDGVTGGLYVGETQWDHGRALVAIDFSEHADLDLWADRLNLANVTALEEQIARLDEELRKVYAARRAR